MFLELPEQWQALQIRIIQSEGQVSNLTRGGLKTSLRQHTPFTDNAGNENELGILSSRFPPPQSPSWLCPFLLWGLVPAQILFYPRPDIPTLSPEELWALSAPVTQSNTTSTLRVSLIIMKELTSFIALLTHYLHQWGDSPVREGDCWWFAELKILHTYQ